MQEEIELPWMTMQEHHWQARSELTAGNTPLFWRVSPIPIKNAESERPRHNIQLYKYSIQDSSLELLEDNEKEMHFNIIADAQRYCHKREAVLREEMS